jgi:hypothetical protein
MSMPPRRSSATRRCGVYDEDTALATSLIKAKVSEEIFGLVEAALDVSFQYSLNPRRSQRRSVFFLDDEKGLLPCTRRSSEKDQDQMIPLCAGRSFDLPTDDELLPEAGVFATSADVPLARSVTIANMREALEGLVRSTKWW